MNPSNLLRSLFALIFCVSSLLAQEDASSMTEAEIQEAQAEYQQFLDSLGWQDEGLGELEEWATIDIPAGFRFLNGADADALLQAFGNLPDDYEGMIAVEDVDWFVLFQFEDSGYVKDDEKDDLAADKLLKSLQESDGPSNEYRRQQGIEPLYTEGWAMEPRYNELTNNLEWGIVLRSESGNRSVNYLTKLLGRDGIMNVTLVCDPEDLEYILPTYQELLIGHQYKAGKSYAEYQQGDKVATYGLSALIAGGALYGAAKLGLLGNLILFLKKFFKIVIVGLVAVGLAIKKFFSRLAGRETVEADSREG